MPYLFNLLLGYYVVVPELRSLDLRTFIFRYRCFTCRSLL